MQSRVYNLVCTQILLIIRYQITHGITCARQLMLHWHKKESTLRACGLTHCVHGDSVTRYQWLALATSFHRGTELDTAEFPSSANEREWTNWNTFFNGTNNRLQPNGRCDCFRSDAHPLGSKITENRYFWLPGKLNLTYNQVLSQARNKADNWKKAHRLPIIGKWAPTQPLNDECNRDGMQKTFAPKWRFNWTDAI
jgi:hypothetical protein